MRSNLRPSARAIDLPSEVLPTPGGPTRQRIELRAGGAVLSVGHQLAHGEELEDAVLHLLDVVVVLVEHSARVAQVEVVLGALAPRQRGDPLQVAADHAVLGCRRRQPLEPRQLAVDLLARLLRQLERVELLAQLVRLGEHLVAFAELVLDRSQLLAQEVLALRSVELGLDLRLDLRAERDDLQLAARAAPTGAAAAVPRRAPPAAPASPPF